MDIDITGTAGANGANGSTPGASGYAGGVGGSVARTNNGNATDNTNTTEVIGGEGGAGGNGLSNSYGRGGNAGLGGFGGYAGAITNTTLSLLGSYDHATATATVDKGARRGCPATWGFLLVAMVRLAGEAGRRVLLRARITRWAKPLPALRQRAASAGQAMGPGKPEVLAA